MTNQPERWTACHFSLANPAGPGQDDVPKLLRRVADALEGYGNVEVHDLVLHNEVTADGDWPSVTVYFSDAQPPDAARVASGRDHLLPAQPGGTEWTALREQQTRDGVAG